LPPQLRGSTADSVPDSEKTLRPALDLEIAVDCGRIRPPAMGGSGRSGWNGIPHSLASEMQFTNKLRSIQRLLATSYLITALICLLSPPHSLSTLAASTSPHLGAWRNPRVWVSWRFRDRFPLLILQLRGGGGTAGERREAADWRMMMSRSRKRPYWVHVRSGETTWAPPRGELNPQRTLIAHD
jgi:hypothetical protein